MTETVITNARIVLSDAVIAGDLAFAKGVIAGIGAGAASGSALDFDGDFLLPGLVELHTDNLEKHFSPRPGVRWPAIPAVMGHDAQIATAGITTVLDAIAIGDVRQDSTRVDFLNDMVDAIETAREQGVLRADHFLHLRCEVSFEQMMEAFDRLSSLRSLKLVSIMDHTPGQRQFVSLDKYRIYYQGKYGFNDEQMTAFMERQIITQKKFAGPNRAAIVERCHAKGIPLASHDDGTREHVAEALEDSMAVAEFPTTVEAADLSRQGGLQILMGGPNLVRGGSHSGNVSARALAEAGLLDIISSDYVPASLLQGLFMLADQVPEIGLPAAVAMGAANPARAVGLDDRGVIAEGKRADLIRVRVIDGVPLVRAVWRAGERVA